MNNAQGKFRAVCFDCDSTLSGLEGIDELASRYGRKGEVALLTEALLESSSLTLETPLTAANER